MKHILIITLAFMLTGSALAQESRPAGKTKVKTKSKTVQPAEQPKAEAQPVKKIGPARNLPQDLHREQPNQQK